MDLFDLQARSRKFRDLTNERKNMSTKTNFKRVALVAVAALGLGVLTSVAPASAAAVNLTVGTNSSTGAAILYDASGPTVGKSVGLSGSVDTTTATAQTAVLRTNGTLSVKVNAPTTGAKWTVVTVTGGTIVGGVDGTAGDLAVSSARTLAGSTTSDYYGLLIQPTAAGTTLVVSVYDDATAKTASTGGTLTDRLYVTVTASTDIAKLSPAKSFLKVAASAASAAVTNNTDTVSALTVAYDGEAAIGFSLADVNGVDMPTTTIVSATATNGVLVSLGASGSQVASSASGYYDGTYDNVFVYSEDGAVDTVVTISVDGVVWASKTLKFLGDVASIEIKNPSIGLQGSTGNFYLNVKDAAGNLIGSVTPVLASGVVNASITGATPAASSATSSSALSTFNCSTLPGSANLAVYTVNANLKVITSNVLKVTCAYTAYTYSASLDKASYVPGDIATLTITAKDKYGAAPADNSVLGTATTYELGIAGSQMTAVTAPTNADTFTSGVKTYKFVVGQTEGSYNMIVDLKQYNSPATPQAAVTVAYKVASSSTAVSNADVLKAIVSLIASINKQIAALQKALLKK